MAHLPSGISSVSVLADHGERKQHSLAGISSSSSIALLHSSYSASLNHLFNCCSGKSSRVPQLLQEELNGPIICTQPRRLAVVAIARHVAQLVGCELGREVGFRIGQKSVASHKTKILFTTAGLLLEELRANVSEGWHYSNLVQRHYSSQLCLRCI